MKLAAPALLAVIALAGCATAAHRGAAPLDEFLPYAGAPVEEFRFVTFTDWQQVDDEHVVLWVDLHDAYLLTVAAPCFDLNFSEYLGVSSTLHTISRFESLFPGHRDRCPITEIRPLDVQRLKADRAAARAAARASKAGAAQ
jgi:hypothetical protein